MISTSDAILLGSSMYPANDGASWVSKDGSCGCALGRAYLAAGGVVPTDRTVCAADICDIWPWLKAEDVMNEISEMFCGVVGGHLTMDELVDFVASREPAALEATIESIMAENGERSIAMKEITLLQIYFHIMKDV